MTAYCETCGQVVPDAAEASDRRQRVRTVDCPHCGAGQGEPCVSPAGAATTTHGARWTAWYEQQRTAVTPVTTDAERDKARTVACPVCAAGPGEPCLNTFNGQPGNFVHLGRVIASERTP